MKISKAGNSGRTTRQTKKKHKREPAANMERILDESAKLILEKGLVRTSIKEIAKRAGVTPALIHANFRGTGKDSTLLNIVQAIFVRFLDSTQDRISTGLELQSRSIRPTLRLVTILRATLKAFDHSKRLSVSPNPAFGHVVLQELDLRHQKGTAGAERIFAIFDEVDRIIQSAHGDQESKSELTPRAMRLAPWKIRMALFGLTYFLLRSKYVDDIESPTTEEASLQEREIEIIVLGFLQSFCTEDMQKEIEIFIREAEEELPQ
jgi:AcrR family transcriptional regulator